MFLKIRFWAAKLLVGKSGLLLPAYSSSKGGRYPDTKWEVENYCPECLNAVDLYHRDFECACLVCGSQQCLSPMTLRSCRMTRIGGVYKYQFLYPGNPESMVTVSVIDGLRMRRGKYKKEEACS